MENNTTQNTPSQGYQQAAGYPQAVSVASSAVQYQRKPKKSGFLTFVCALVPGCGQMYHGLLKKGISIMILFWGIIALASFLYIGEIAFVLPVIWFYSFFDAVNRMNMPLDEMKLLKDEYLFLSSKPQDRVMSKIYEKRHVIFGSVLVFIGAFSILNSYSISNAIAMALNIDYYQVRDMMSLIPGLIIPILCIVFGIYLLFKTLKKEKSEK